MKNFIKLMLLAVILSSQSANATVILNNFTITGTSLSFDVNGTVTTMGTNYQHQLMFGLVDDNADWISSFDAGSSSVTAGAANARAINRLYDLTGSWTDSLLTVGEYWQIGDIIDLSFDFVGVFNVANFDMNNFGMSVGLNTQYSIVPGDLNLVTAVNGSNSVPEPGILSLVGLGLLGFRLSKCGKRKV